MMNNSGMRRSARILGTVLTTMAINAWAQEPADNDAFLDALLQQQPGEDSAAADATPASTASPSSASAQLTPVVETIPVPSRESSQQPQPAAAPRPASQIEEIVVTATKRAESLREIPATINVLAGKDLEREGVQSIDQIVNQVPGVNLTDEGTGGEAKRITIRGISGGTGLNPTAGTLFGDTPFSDPYLPKVQLDPNPFDMATVEVLKGPQGTLFGGTGLNGLIRYVPQAPQLDEFRVKYYTQFTAYPGVGDSGWNHGAVVNLPFADNSAALRLLGFHREAPGYVDDQYNDKKDVNHLKQYGVRAALAWEPSERWKLSLMAATQQTTENDLAFTDNYDGRLSRGNTPRPSPSEYGYTLGTLTVERSFDWSTLISQTSYFSKQYEAFVEASRAVGGQLPLLGGADDNHSDGFTQELRLVSATGDSPWKWLAGVFYYRNDLYDCADIGAGQGLPTLPALPLLNGLVSSPCAGNAGKLAGTVGIGQLKGDIALEEQALFGETTRRLGERWEVTLGARAYRIQSGGAVTTAGILYASANQGQSVNRTADVGEQGISPKASIAFIASDDLRFYFTASRGFRFGGPQISASTPTTTVPAVYKSDSLWSYEIGLRTDWLDGALQLDASAYHIDWKDPQVKEISQDGLTGFINNVGGAEGNGVEMSLTWLPGFLEGLSLNANVAWSRTVTTEQFRSASGTDVTEGSPWPMAPRWQTATTLSYERPVASWSLGGSLRHVYLGQACNKIECTAQVFGYRTLDFNLFATPEEDSRWPGLSLSVANLTDERGYSSVGTNPQGDSITYIAPRTLVLRLSGEF